jgi:hypothetical protein
MNTTTAAIMSGGGDDDHCFQYPCALGILEEFVKMDAVAQHSLINLLSTLHTKQNLCFACNLSDIGNQSEVGDLESESVLSSSSSPPQVPLSTSDSLRSPFRFQSPPPMMMLDQATKPPTPPPQQEHTAPFSCLLFTYHPFPFIFSSPPQPQQQPPPSGEPSGESGTGVAHQGMPVEDFEIEKQEMKCPLVLDAKPEINPPPPPPTLRKRLNNRSEIAKKLKKKLKR